MRILFLTQVLPFPLDAGPKVRAYYTLRHIAARHTVTLASFVRDSDGPEAVAHLQTFCEKVVTVRMRRSRLRDGLALGRSLISGEPFLIARDRVPRMHAALRELATRNAYDAIHTDQLWMAPYALAASRHAGHRPRLVLDQHNAVYLVSRRLAEAARNPLLRWWLNLEAGRLARFEARTCRQFDRVVTVTPEDGQALAGLYADGRPPPSFPVIPICVDPGPAPATAPWPDEPGILFLGGMHWPPNRDGVLWFAHDVLPRVRAGLPRAQFFAVGRQPPGELRAVEAAVSVPGYVVAADAYWARSQVFVVPLRAGGGMRVKILDAWARGLPVVSTVIGAEGLSCRHGEDILIADTPEAFASAVLRVLTERGLSERLSRGGRSTVERRYNWRLVYPAWDEIYAPLETESAGLGAAGNS